MHFKLSDHQKWAWALPNETPTVPERPWKGLKTCSVIAAVSVQTGALLYTIGETFQKQEDVVQFVAKICSESPPGKKVAILWDNASSHKARSVQDYLRTTDTIAIANVPYHPQYNGIEHVFSDVRRRYRKKITDLKISGADEIDLREVVSATFAATLPAVVRAQCLRGW